MRRGPWQPALDVLARSVWADDIGDLDPADFDDGDLAFDGDALYRCRSSVAWTQLSQPNGTSLPTSGLVLHLDASLITGHSDGDPVSTWADLSGNGHDATQPDSDGQPTFVAAVQNGHAAVRFDQTTFNQQLVLSGAALGMLRNRPGVTVAAAWRQAIGVTAITSLFTASSGQDISNERVQFEVSAGDGRTDMRTGNDDTVDMGDEAYVPGASIGPSCVVGIGAVDYVQAGLHAITSASSQADNSSFGNTPGTPFPDTDSVAITIGVTTDMPVADAPTGGITDLCELAVYDFSLDASARRQLFEYLCAKWAPA